MTLEFTVTQYPFRFGLAEGTDPFQVPPGTLTVAENVEWQKSGKVQKRRGTTLLTKTVIGGTTLSTASRLFSRGAELCLIDGTSMYAYAPTFAQWKNVGKVPNVGLTSTTIIDSVGGVAQADSAISAGGLRVDAWLTGAGGNAALFVQVVDAGDGSIIIPPVQVLASSAACQGVRVVTIGTTAIIVTANITATAITAATINLTTLAVSATSNLRTDMNVGAPSLSGWDICVIGTNFVLAYTNTAPALKLYSYNSSLTQQATGGITSEAVGALSVSIDGASGEVLYVFYIQGATAGPKNLVKIAIADPTTLVQSVAPVTVETPATSAIPTQAAVCRYDSTNCIAAYRTAGATTGVRVTSYQITSAGSVTTTTQRGTYGTSLVSRPFMLGGACYIVLQQTGTGTASTGAGARDASTILVEAETSPRTSTYTPHRYVGCIDVLIGGKNVFASMVPASVAVLSSTSVFVPVPFQSTTSTVVTRQGMRLANITTGASLPPDTWRSTVSNQDLFLSAGVFSAYDGRSIFDYGFPNAPSFHSVTASNSGGSVALGTYLFGGVLEYRSATGLLYRGPTQVVGGTAVVGGANNTVTITSGCYQLGNKQTTSTLFGTSTAIPTLLAWYRTTVGGTVYQRETIEPTYNATFVDQMVEDVTFVDSSADGSVGGSGISLATRPAIYTAGGILDDYAPPGCVTQFHHVDRLWTLANDQKTWWHSKAFQDDAGVAPGFHPNFRIIFDDVQTAGASMDDKAVFFSATGVKYMQGTGPNPFGLASDFQTPTTIQSDVGCTNARSVVTTPDGVMFLSARGIYLLDRGMTLSWIGRPVKDKLAAFPNITSAVLVAKRNQVRFTCNDVAGTSGCTIVYDYVERQWSAFVHGAGVSGFAGFAIADACMWNGAWCFVTPGGQVYVESEATYLDGSTWVAMTLETAWITPPSSQASPSQGPLKFQSVRTFSIHGTSNTDHDLTVQVAFDSEAAYSQSITFPATGDVTAVGSPEDCEVTIGTRRKCGAIRFRIYDATPTAGTIGTGQGPDFDIMGLELGIKRGFGNTPATRKG